MGKKQIFNLTEYLKLCLEFAEKDIIRKKVFDCFKEQMFKRADIRLLNNIAIIGEDEYIINGITPYYFIDENGKHHSYRDVDNIIHLNNH